MLAADERTLSVWHPLCIMFEKHVRQARMVPASGKLFFTQSAAEIFPDDVLRKQKFAEDLANG